MGSPPKRSGNMPHAPGPSRGIGGVRISVRRERSGPIATAVAVGGTSSRRRRSASSRPTASACMILRATSLSGSKTVRTTTITMHQQMATRPGKSRTEVIVPGVRSAVAPGSTLRRSSARRPAPGTTPTTGTTSSVFVSPRTYSPFLFVLLPFGGGQGAKPPGRAILKGNP
jgi:hypothetical protein